MMYFNNKRVLITGSEGFVGQNLIDFFLKQNSYIFGLDKIKKKSDKNYISATFDLNDFKLLKKWLEDIKPDYIINLASIVGAERDFKNYDELVDINFNLIFNFYKAINQAKLTIKLFINFGSIEEYGDYGLNYCREDSWEKSNSLYSLTKTAGSRLIYMLSKNENFPAITIRPSMLFGELQRKTKFFPYLINSLKNDDDIFLTHCSQTRDLLYIKRFCQMLLQLISSENYESGEIFNISTGIEIELKEVVMHIKKRFPGSKSKIFFGAKEYRKNEPMHQRISNKKIKKIINFEINKDMIFNDMNKYIDNFNNNYF